MSAKSAINIQGFEYDWLAVDADGFVGFFSTAGGGYAPDAFLADTEVYDQAIDELLASPMRTTARFAPTVRGDLRNDWRAFAERGFYAYDARESFPDGGPYHLVAEPTRASRFSDLDAKQRRVVGRVVLRALRFASTPMITTVQLERALGERVP